MYLAIYNIGLPLRADTDEVLDMSGLYGGEVKQLPYIAPMINQDLNFDNAYHDYLLRYDFPFVDLMKIIYPLYEYKSVAILYNPSANLYLNHLESLLQFIYLRYGIIASRFNELEDIQYPVETEFSIPGLYNLDLDKARYITLLGDPSTWTKPPMFSEPLQQLYSR